MIKIFKTPMLFRKLFSRRVWGFDSLGKVYLTFDDGPTEELTGWILSFLRSQGIKATFFCVGENAKNHPLLMTEIINDGHVIGNHTMRHEKGVQTSKNDFIRSIDEANQFVPSTIFRPPYGRMPIRFDKDILKTHKIIMWSWLSYDFDESVSVQEILKRAQKQIKSGDIIVLHDNIKVSERLKEILPELVQIIKEKGLTFEVISS